MFVRGRRAAKAIALAAFSIACFAVALPAGAHTVGGPCVAALEHCERWSATITGPTRPSGQRPDDFPVAVAVNGTSVFAGSTAVNLNVSNPYISTAAWTLAAYDQATGALRWRVFRKTRIYDSLHGIAVSPDGRTVVATGGAYNGFPVGATDSRITTAAFDASTGRVRWSATWDGNPKGTDNAVAVSFSPDGSSVYVGGITAPTPGALNFVTIAYDAATGKQRWSRTFRGFGAGGINSLSGLAVSPDGTRVYVTGESAGTREYELDYATVAYDALTGTALWVRRLPTTFVNRPCCLAVDKGHVFVTGDSYSGPGGGDYQALTVALRASDGALSWKQRLGGKGYNGGRAIAAGAGRVVVTTQSPGSSSTDGLDARTAAYSASSGRELWERRLAEPARSELANGLAVAPDGTRVYLTASSRPTVPYTALDDQEVVAYNLSDGASLWTVHLDSGAGNALTGDQVVASQGDSIFTLGQVKRSASPLDPSDQNIYDTLVVALPR